MQEPDQLRRAFIDAAAGAISGAISRTLTSPLDVIKIRFQVISLNTILLSEWSSFSCVSLWMSLALLNLSFWEELELSRWLLFCSCFFLA